VMFGRRCGQLPQTCPQQRTVLTLSLSSSGKVHRRVVGIKRVVRQTEWSSEIYTLHIACRFKDRSLAGHRKKTRISKFDFKRVFENRDRLCGLVVSVEDYKHRGPGFDSLRIFLRELGLKRGPLSLVIG
jgi:hypothetical protein